MDGVVDASDTYPVDAAKSIDVPDFSDAVTAEIGAASGVEAIEGNLALWFDASNADSIEKDANYRISQWKDLSGNAITLAKIQLMIGHSWWIK